jgi:hypothetical protein
MSAAYGLADKATRRSPRWLTVVDRVSKLGDK